MPANEHVVLVHGLWMHGAVMGWMARRIERSGYTVHCYTYPSVRMSLAENARRLAVFCQTLNARPLHLVGHSLGGLLIARMLDEPHRLDIGRVVLMGAPFVDSFAARRLSRVRLGCMAVGASIGEWLRGARPESLADYDIGVIAGNRGVGLGVVMAPDLPEPHDGTICVSETMVPGARDHIVLPVTHTQMVFSLLMVRQVCEFLRRGSFARGEGVRS
ncbi:MAG: alpha/beta fold hydrolase [Burkholderiales bacterium]